MNRKRRGERSLAEESEFRAQKSVDDHADSGYPGPMHTLPSPSTMYRALLSRDTSYDGVFWVGVRTTGIFCRPTCTAKKPQRKNVEFFATAQQALHAGYRPCKRCRPMDGVDRAPAWVKRILDKVERAPTGRITDADLRSWSIDPARARRYFKEHYGMTFQAYHRARRMGAALAAVRQGQGIDAVGLRHGFESSSGFRDAFERVFGCAPGNSRETKCLLARWLDTPLGGMVAVADDQGLFLLEFVDRRGLETQIRALRRRLACTILPGDNGHLAGIAEELSQYFEGNLTRFTIPLVLPGTPFQLDVWKRLTAIPFGATRSYSDLAEQIGCSGGQRAVGRANGENRIAILIPCHRVVRSDGTLCGYGGGLWRKKWLLDHERGVRAATLPAKSGYSV